MKTLTSFVITLALIVGMVGCSPAPGPTEYNLTISSTEGGSVTSPGEPGPYTYDEGEVISLVAEPDEGYHFDNWTGDVGTVANVSSALTSITMNDDYSIIANFASGPAIPPKDVDSFVQMTIGDVDSLDPAWGYDTASGEQVQYIYETLLFYDGNYTDRFVPVLATDWIASTDGKTIRFKIRQGVKFHEGGDLTPEDVEYSFERAMVQDRGGGPVWMFYATLLGLDGSRDGNGNIAVTFDQIDDVVEVDGDWVQFNLVAAYPTRAFYQILCGPWASIVDKEWCIDQDDWDGTGATWKKHNNPAPEASKLYAKANGTGPWKLEEWDPGVQITLVRNDVYWRGSVPFNHAITQVVENWTTRKEALLAGDADLVYVPPMYVGELECVDDLNVYQDLRELMVDAFLFNMDIASNSTYIGSGALDGNGIPPNFFTDTDVRKGFCYAFDYETFIEDAFLGDAQRLGSPVVEGLPFYNPNASMYSYNLVKAADHLSRAWNGTVWDKGFKFTLIYKTGNIRRKTACQILAEGLSGVNSKFQVSVLPVQWSSILEMIKTGTMPMFQINWMADYPDPDHFVVPYMASWGWHGGLFTAYQGYSNSHVDDLVRQGVATVDTSRRQQIYYELQQIYYEDAPGIVLGQPLGRRYFTKYIHGFYFNPMICGQAGPLYHMSKSSS